MGRRPGYDRSHVRCLASYIVRYVRTYISTCIPLHVYTTGIFILGGQGARPRGRGALGHGPAGSDMLTCNGPYS